MATTFAGKRTTLSHLRQPYLFPLLVRLLLLCMFAPARYVCGSLATNAERLLRAERILAAVPEAVRDDFLLYQLAAAINSNNSQDNGEYVDEVVEEVVEEVEEHWESWQEWQNWSHTQHTQSIGGDYSSELLDWLAVNYEITPNDLFKALRMRSANSPKPKQICNAKGRCYALQQLSSEYRQFIKEIVTFKM